MIDVMLILIICLLAVGAARLQMRMQRRQSGPASRYSATVSDKPASIGVQEESLDDPQAYTVSLIGQQAYDAMKMQVESVMNEHKGQPSTIFRLCRGAETSDGKKCLHSLLPGDQLFLIPNLSGGLSRTDVYSKGIFVGSLLLTEAETALHMMSQYNVKGVYVAEQNCYGDVDGVDLSLIMFYQAKPKTQMVAAMKKAFFN